MAEDEQLAAAKVAALFKLLPNSTIGALGAAMICFVYWSPELSFWLIVWCCFVAAHIAMANGLVLLSRLGTLKLGSRWLLRVQTAIYLFSGLSWGGGIGLLLPYGNSDQNLVALLVALGSVVVSFPSILHLPAYLSVQVPVLLFSAAGMLFSSNPYGPLIAVGALVLSGFLSVTGKMMGDALGGVMRLSAANSELAERLSIQAASLREVNDRLVQINLSDPLTGLGNRRALMQTLRAERGNSKCAVLLVDIDKFRNYGDVFGHVARDRCLTTIAGLLGNVAKTRNGVAFRYRVEEFAIVLTGVSPGSAVMAAEEVRAAVEGAYDAGARLNRRVTVSIGVAADLSRHGVDELLDLAASALEDAKQDGRNLVVGPRVEHRSVA
ncbi:MAG: GGDEF domain-containing protein [Mesorhizobium sp.]